MMPGSDCLVVITGNAGRLLLLMLGHASFAGRIFAGQPSMASRTRLQVSASAGLWLNLLEQLTSPTNGPHATDDAGIGVCPVGYHR